MSRFDRIDRQMNTFHDMVDRLGIDPIDLARDCLGYRLATAVRRCAACDAGEACREWLDRTATAQNAPAFCPNADIFAFARRKPAAVA